MIQHKHIILRATVKNPITDPKHAVEWFNEMVEEIGMKKLKLDEDHIQFTFMEGHGEFLYKVPQNPICGYVETPGNRGLTIVGIIETSHIAMHIWDEQDPALVQLDVYTCSDLPKYKIIKKLDEMKPVNVEWEIYDREHKLSKVE